MPTVGCQRCTRDVFPTRPQSSGKASESRKKKQSRKKSENSTRKQNRNKSRKMVVDIKMCRFDNVPWGFRLVGGADYDYPLTVVKVRPDSKRDRNLYSQSPGKGPTCGVCVVLFVVLECNPHYIPLPNGLIQWFSIRLFLFFLYFRLQLRNAVRVSVRICCIGKLVN